MPREKRFISNNPPITGVFSLPGSPAEVMAAFDALPPELRELCNHAPYKLSAKPLLDALHRGHEPRAVAATALTQLQTAFPYGWVR